jgi:uncharacterized protein
MGDNCCQYFVVEFNGDIYPCDFFVRDDLLLGNILEDNWANILDSPIYRSFGKQKSRWYSDCNSCSFIYLCHGDCQKFRTEDLNSSKALSVLCKGWKKFYTHALPKLEIISDKIKKGKKISSNQIRSNKIGRNSPCPCGSGNKYKNCCLK